MKPVLSMDLAAITSLDVPKQGFNEDSTGVEDMF